MNKVSEHEYHGKKVRISYIYHRGYYVMSINNRLHPSIFKTEIEAMQEAYRLVSAEQAAGI